MKRLTAVLMAICIMLSANMGWAMSQGQLEKQRETTEERMEKMPEVTFEELAANEDYYYKKSVKVRGVCTEYLNGNALLGDGGNGTFGIKVMSYQFKPGTEYTVIGKFAGIMKTKEGNHWAILVEECHLPFMSEYGL